MFCEKKSPYLLEQKHLPKAYHPNKGHTTPSTVAAEFRLRESCQLPPHTFKRPRGKPTAGEDTEILPEKVVFFFFFRVKAVLPPDKVCLGSASRIHKR